MQVPYDEGVANHIAPESCVGGREAVGEALTGARVGQPLSGERLLIRSADAFQSAEGNTIRRASASAGRLRVVCRPWHARTSPGREPRDLHPARTGRVSGRTGRPRAVACDVRDGEVRPAHSTWEVDEQSGERRGGADGGKGWGRRECGTAKHGPDTEPGCRVTGAGSAYEKPSTGTGRRS